MSPEQARVPARGLPLGARFGPVAVAGRPTSATSLEGALIELQRLAGNQAVSRQVAPTPTATETPDTLSPYAEMWDSQVMERLALAKEDVAKPQPADKKSVDYRQYALLYVYRALAFVLKAFDVTPRDHPTWIKLQILGRSLDGIKGVLSDRLKHGGDTVGDDLRSWRENAVLLGPELRFSPAAAGSSKTTPADSAQMAERWHEGVVLPLGRAIVRAERDVTAAISEASLALEVIHKWREAAPTGDLSRLQLISLERGLYYSLERLREQAWGKGQADLVGNLDTTIKEAAVIGPLLATTPAKKVEPPPPTPPTAPATPSKTINDTELEKP
jgi:hypothetical protein